MSAREGGKRRDTGSFCFPGLRAGSSAGPKGFPEALFYFYFFFLLFFFCFLISFVAFANLVQIDSNQFVNFLEFNTAICNCKKTSFLNKV
jgi:hypothetical protein